jgi:hypothetical protein
MTDGTDKTTEAPTVIDLEADEVRPEAPPPPKPVRKTPWRTYGAVALALAAALGGAWLYRGYGAAWWPSSEMQTLAERVTALEASRKTVNDQAAELAAQLDSLRTSLNEVASGAAKSAEEAKASVAPLAARLDKAETDIAGLRTTIDELNASLAQGGNTNTVPAPDFTRLTALEARVAELEKTIAALKTGPGPDAQTATQLSQSLADLKAKLAAGAPYKDEFDRLATLVPAAPGLDVLQSHAASGLPNAAGLAKELETIAASLPDPEAPPPTAEKGYWDEFTDMLGSLVIVRRIGEADWPDAARKAHALAVAGDLKKAIDTLEAVEGEKPAAIADWLKRARTRLAAEAAAEDVAAAVLRQIAALGGVK